MKKLLSIILIAVLLLSVFIFPINAEEGETFTLKEAHELAFESYRRYYYTTFGFHQCYNNGYEVAFMSEFYVLDNVDWNNLDDYCVTFDKSSDGKKYEFLDSYEYSKFITAPNLPDFVEESYKCTIDKNFNQTFNTIEDVKNYLKEVFTVEMAEEQMYTTVTSYPGGEKSDRVETFRYSDKGELLSLVTPALFDPFFGHEYVKSGNLKVDGDKAEISVILRHTVIVDESLGGGEYAVTTIEFENTSSGWRVSGGTTYDGTPKEYIIMPQNTLPPLTSDPTALYLIPLALIPLAAPLVMKRRRDF